FFVVGIVVQYAVLLSLSVKLILVNMNRLHCSDPYPHGRHSPSGATMVSSPNPLFPAQQIKHSPPEVVPTRFSEVPTTMVKADT
ncbi:hypothetical protein BDW69DRAFT_170108, partial [Aspergillus filifer]